MKQTRSALTMLLNAYKSVFKSAWLKGAASAVVLTAGLAAGASQAATQSDTYVNTSEGWFVSDAGQSSVSGGTVKATAVAGGIAGSAITKFSGSESITTDEQAVITAATSVSGKEISVGSAATDNIDKVSGNAFGGYVQGEYDGKLSATENTLILNNGAEVYGSAIGGRAKNTGNGTAVADGNKLIVNASGANSIKMTGGAGSSFMGGWASSKHGASATGNSVEITNTQKNNALVLDKSIYGGNVWAETNASEGNFVASQNTVSLKDVNFSGAGLQIAGGNVFALATEEINKDGKTPADDNVKVELMEASNNSISLDNVTVTSGSDASLIVGNFVNNQASYKDGSGASALVESYRVIGSADTPAVDIQNSEVNHSKVYGGYVTAAFKGNVVAQDNSVAIDSKSYVTGSAVYGASVELNMASAGSDFNLSNNSVTIADGTEDKHATLTATNVIGAELGGATVLGQREAVSANTTVRLQNNIVTVGDQAVLAADENQSGSTVKGAVLTGDILSNNVVMTGNKVVFNGKITGNLTTKSYSEEAKANGVIIGAQNATNNEKVSLTGNAVEVNGKVKDGFIAAVVNSPSADAGQATLTNNSVVIGATADIDNSDIYAAYNNDSAALTTGSSVTVHGKVQNSSIYGGAGANSAVSLESDSSYTVGQNESAEILSDVVKMAGQTVVGQGATLTVKGYYTDGKSKANASGKSSPAVGSNTVNTNATTIASTAKVYNRGNIVLQGATEVESGAVLQALASNANIKIDGDSSEAVVDDDISDNRISDSEQLALTGGKGSLKLSVEQLKDYLTASKDSKVTINEQEFEDAAGSVTVTSGGVLEFTDASVVMSDLDFANTDTAGKITVDKTGSSVFKGNTISIEHALASDGSTKTKDWTAIDAGGVEVDANVLNLGASDLSSKQSEAIKFKEAVAKSEINFAALSDGKDDAGTVNDGYHLTSAVVGSNYVTTKNATDDSEFYTAQNGTINGNVIVQKSGSISVDAGNFTANGTITLAGGNLSVGGASVHGIEGTFGTHGLNNTVNAPDATLKTAKVVLDVTGSNASAIKVEGAGSLYDVDDAADTQGDDRLTVLDMTSGLSMKTVATTGKANTSATVEATSGGVILVKADDVNAMLTQNHDSDVQATSGAIFKANENGVIVAQGDLKTSFDDFTQTADNKGINLSGSSSAGYLVADTLTVSNVAEGSSLNTPVEDAKNVKSVNFGGKVVVGDLTINDLQTTTGVNKPANASTYNSVVDMAGGDVLVKNSLKTENYNLQVKGGSLNFATDKADGEGSISAQNITVSGAKVNVINGKWDANGTSFNVGGATDSTLTIGGSTGFSAFIAEDDSDYSAELTAKKITLADANGKLVVNTNGAATFATADFFKATAAGQVTVSGDLTITGDAKATIKKDGKDVQDPHNGVAFGSEGSISIAKNGTLTFGSAAVNGAILKDGQQYETAKSVTDAIDEDYTKIANNGGTLKLEFAKGTVFGTKDAEGKVDGNAILTLKQSLFTSGSFVSGTNQLANGGILNIGDAGFYGVEVKPLSGDGLSGYTAKWEDLKDFSDIYGDDVTNEQLLQTNVSDIKVSDQVQGHWGSLSMSSDAAASAQVNISGWTTLNGAAANNGFFVSNADHSAAMGADVQKATTLELKNGGQIGKVTLQAGGADDRNETVLSVSGEGKTVIASIEGITTGGTSGINNSTSVDILAETSVTDSITNVEDVFVNGAALSVGKKITAHDLTAISGTVSAETGSIYDATLADAAVTFKDLTFNGSQERSIDVLAGSTLTVTGTMTNASVGELNVGWDMSEEDEFVADLKEHGIENPTGTGYAQIAELENKGGIINVDPVYGEATSILSVGKFKDASHTYKFDNDKGALNGSLRIGKNAVAAVGMDLDEARAAIARYQTAGSLSEDNYGSMLLLNGQLTLTEGSEIALNSDSKVTASADIRNTLRYDINGNTYKEADLGLGKNTAILMTEQAFENDKGEKTETAVFFDKKGAVVNGLGGEIVLAGSFDTSDSLSIFNDKDDNGVDVKGSIKVVTQNGFLFTTLEGDNQGKEVQLEVDKDKAYQVMNQASNPVVETLIAYGNRNIKAETPEPDETPDTAPEAGTTEEPAGNVTAGTETNAGANVSVNDGSIPWTDLVPAEPAGDDTTAGDQDKAPAVAKSSSSFLDAVITTTHGAPAETVARMAVYGGSVEAVMAAASTSSDAIAARMGMGNQNSVLTYADNADGAGIWLAPVYKHHESDGFGAQGVDYGADIDLYGLSLGADYTFAQGFRAGAMFNVGSGDADGQGAGSAVSNDFDYWGISVYGGYSYEDFSVIADIGYTTVDNDLDAASGVEGFGKLTASTDTESWTVGVTAQYKLSTDYVDITPHIGARFTRIDMDNYSVNSAAGKIADFSADSMNVFSIPVGVSFSSELTTDSGWKVMPALDLTVTANTGDDEFDGDVAWTGTNLTTATSTEVLDDVTYGVNLGLSAEYNSFSFGLGVNYVGSDNTDEYGVQANARFTF